ncbi:uncharacterized protein LOC130689375 [Daphnia carinata]|uniref:uncharacterized protein LOC130689375 n=1 Tax=Daphnia carinata TaxID=120202 RepID=UPI00257F08B4|nr:uncharacterized protein LOC130689375 [Daphnia carinata]
MRSSISQFVTLLSLTVFYLVVIGFNGILAEEYANLRKMEVEHRRNLLGNLTETRDHYSGHGSHGYNRGPYSSTSQDKYKRPKPDYLAPKPQSKPSTSSHLPYKALNQAPAYKAPSYTPPAYNPVAYSQPAYSPPTNKPPASSSPAYSAPVYNSPTYSPPAYNPPAYSSPTYTPKGVESPAYTESPGNKSPAYPSSAYSEAPASEPEYPYQNIPEKNNGVRKGIFHNSDFPKFDDFVQHVESIKFDQFKI